MNQPDQHLATRDRFDSEAASFKYAQRKNDDASWRNRRELRCIEAALSGVPRGSRVLDLPTGTGRLLPVLVARGFDVVAGDTSTHMLAGARSYCESRLSPEQRSRIQFLTLDVMATGLPDQSIDVAICNRLLHHYPDGDLRRQALRELARITRGRVVVSYFSNVAVSAARFHLMNRLLRRPARDRVPIWPAVMAADAGAAGLQVCRSYRVRAGLSPQTYVVLAGSRQGL